MAPNCASFTSNPIHLQGGGIDDSHFFTNPHNAFGGFAAAASRGRGMSQSIPSKSPGSPKRGGV
jgi:hypothetical protein